MLDVLVYTDTVRSRDITSKKTGEIMTFRDQEAFLVHPQKPHPLGFKLQLDKGAQPYKPGRYRILPDSVYVGQFGDVEFAKRLVLERIGDLPAVKPAA